MTLATFDATVERVDTASDLPRTAFAGRDATRAGCVAAVSPLRAFCAPASTLAAGAASDDAPCFVFDAIDVSAAAASTMAETAATGAATIASGAIEIAAAYTLPCKSRHASKVSFRFHLTHAPHPPYKRTALAPT
ncbi:hypothetical protein [Burkholderia sp. AU33803]|uniref:hypothetical protein n=1 Tax=Burkholderia TaxID=32008 RepID=UPI0011816390|nr:hypothetical protein [Burkholderia sp. AU33803]